MAQSNINVYFYDDQERSTSNGTTATTKPVSPVDKNKQTGSKLTAEEKGEKEKSTLRHAIGVNIAHSTLSMVTGNVGVWTGSSDAQDKVNAGMEMAGMGMAFYVNPIFGAINMIFSVVNKVLKFKHDEAINNRQVTQGRERAGVHYNHSR